MFALIAQAQNVFGKIDTPAGVANYDAATGGSNPIGLILFVSNMIKIVTLVAGLLVFLNVILAGLDIIGSNGDASKMEKAKDKILQSVLGLGVIISAYVIIALVGLVFFGDPTYIISPTITGPGN